MTAIHMSSTNRALESHPGSPAGRIQVDHALADDPMALIDAARHDPQAFGTLYRRHYTRIARYLLRRTGSEHVAEDLAAETFLAAMKALPHYRHTGVPISAWFMRIATNKANRWARKQARSVRARRLDSPETSTPTDEARLEQVRTALGLLKPDHQAVLVLHHVERLSVEQVALVLEIRVGTVKSRLHRARAALVEHMEQLGDLP